MTFDEYQLFTETTAIPPKGMVIPYYAMKLCGEAGGVAEKIAKVYRDENGIFTRTKMNELALELGDVLWYITRLACELDYNLSQVADLNVEKLRSRKARGALHVSGYSR